MANPSSDDTFFYISELSNISLVVDKQRQTVHITAIDRETQRDTKTKRQIKQEKTRKYLSIKQR